MKYKGKSIEVIGSKMLFGKETLWIHILEDDSFAQVLRSDLEEDMPETKHSGMSYVRYIAIAATTEEQKFSYKIKNNKRDRHRTKNSHKLLTYKSFTEYSKRDLNPHSRNGQGILSPSCLPIPPFEHPQGRERKTRLEHATLPLARLCSTN